MCFEEIFFLKPCQISAMLEHALGIVCERRKQKPSAGTLNQTSCRIPFSSILVSRTACLQDICLRYWCHRNEFALCTVLWDIW